MDINILDIFNENQVQIMTPSYIADPEVPKIDVRRCRHCGELPFVEVVRDRAETAVLEPGLLAG